jgi:lipoate-protein ligase A
MKWIDFTYPRPEENLACDEALLDLCDEEKEDDILRFWEPSEPVVVLGYSNRWETEVDAPACAERGIPILRRCSGGGTVLLGPGCLNYSLILKIEGDRTLSTITQANRYVLERNARALTPLLGQKPAIRGHTDLTLGAVKFSGNSQRRKRESVLIHGTFLLGMDLALVEACLRMPSLQPDYREGRSHRRFIANVDVSPGAIKDALKREWGVGEPLARPPEKRVRNLSEKVYSTTEWNRKF